MSKPLSLARLLLISTALSAPAVSAQTNPSGASSAGAGDAGMTTTPSAADEAAAQEGRVDVSIPGADIVVTGRRTTNVSQAAPQVVNVLSAADIKRTGEGDIAGSLQRVTGLSVVSGGYVYVRGLGDRYSLALLNGSPLPSPEPLKRVVPLDIFPTSVIASTLVQKSYSANFPGEFGGGVINLTSKAIPKKNFLSIGGSIAADTVTTSELGYVYAGGKSDWIGYDDGTRGVPAFIRNADQGSGIFTADQVAQLNNARTTLLQVNNQLPANLSGEIAGGSVFDIGSDRLGVIASLGLSNTFRTRDAIQQDSVSEDGTVRNDFRTVLTDNRIVANALVGLGYEFNDNTIRWTNVYIHDTLKQGRLAGSEAYNNFSGLRLQQNTNWFERQLIETQLVGEFKLTDALKFDARGAFANSKRNAPYERQFDYLCSNRTTNGYPITTDGAPFSRGFNCNGAYQVTQRFSPFASVVFSELDENLYTGQADLSYKLATDRPITLSTGYFYSNTDRNSRRLQFNYQTSDGAGTAPGFPNNLLRPDYLLSPDSLFNACPQRGTGACTIQLQFNTQNGAYAYDAGLEIHAGYVQAEAEVSDGLRAVAGVRYETAREEVTPIGNPSTILKNGYWLPAGTLTWNFASDMQARLSGAKTISRPQFRELAPQQFRDPDSDRLFFGNPNLRDSELWNLEARYEWFFGRDQRFTAAGFYKRIDRPIEQAGFYPSPDATLQTGFTYLPKATLWGGEVEAQKYVPLESLGNFFATRRLLLLANYTYTQSQITADGSCVPNPAAALGSPGIGGCAAGFGRANLLFRDGAPLTGQSDHLVNVQVGLEDTANLSQLTLLFNYASDRVTNRGPSNLSGQGFQPDIVERPGIRLDLVARQGFEVAGANLEVKAEARNLTGQRYSESQNFGGNPVYINRYDLGRMFSLGITAQF